MEHGMSDRQDMSNDMDHRLAALGSHLESERHFSFLRELATAFPESEAFVVGGIVRDTALGRTAKDYDFIVRGVPAASLETFLALRGTVNLVGRNFGVFKFRPHGWPEDLEDIDIALPRTEHADGTGGYRDVEVQSDHRLQVADDLARRDFTMNAMAWDVQQRRLVDPFNGRDDLRAQRICAVGDPHDRFTEDRSRMLRALRFACQLGFTIDPATLAAIQTRMASINEQRPARKVHEHTTLIAEQEYVTPRETVAKELIKSFMADPVRAFDLWAEAGAVEQLMPELLPMQGCEQPPEYHHEGDVWQHTRLALSLLRSDAYRKEFGDASPSALVVFGVLLHDIGKPPTKRTPEEHGTDRIRFDGHDKAGGALARTIARRLALTSPFPSDHPLHVNTDDLVWLVDHHLLLVNDPSAFGPGTIEKYFFRNRTRGDALQRVSFADGAATRSTTHPDGTLDHFRTVRARIMDLAPLIEQRQERDRMRDVVDGKEIMQHFHIVPGPIIGKLKDALHERRMEILAAERRDMTREEAFAFLEPLVNDTSA
ncbi:MAG: HD domain-containing protein [bacterium]|nr:HD domain-containing protein [bacterium]